MIYPGQELFIDYGDTFFTKDKPADVGSDSEASAVEEGYASGEDEEEDDDDDDDDSGSSISL